MAKNDKPCCDNPSYEVRRLKNGVVTHTCKNCGFVKTLNQVLFTVLDFIIPNKEKLN
jgi:hypothetical protein